MAMTIHVDIVSAEQEIFSGPAEMVFAPAEMGDVGIAPRHAPLLTRLKPGEVRIKTQGGGEEFFYVSGGMLEVQPHVVTVLADVALRAHDIDEAQALEAKRRAEEELRHKSAELDYAKARAQLAEAMAQLQALERLRRTGRR
ncbi:MAG: F0F1 ATP synthase subunit epsilon [Chromatiales bacterium 21-64-14]|nr:MAG: F0F1 ATP synthase subunit epsilon [Chromatiales bacterium 21-64-14]HQU16244.1 F0F1 ATP synthase subunit epsilon [Gammaproteobacteria bacterium]